MSIRNERTEFTYLDEVLSVEKISDRLYLVNNDDETLGLFAEDFVIAASEATPVSFEYARLALTAKERGETSFSIDGKTYTIDADGSIKDESGAAAAAFSAYSISAAGSDVVLTPEIKDRLIRAVEANETEFEYENANYVFSHSASTNVWTVARENPGAADNFTYRDTEYSLKRISRDFFCIYTDGELIGIAGKKIVSGSSSNASLPFDFTYNALMADVGGERSFSSEGKSYTIDDDGVVYEENGEEVAYISEYIVRAVMGDVFLSREFKNQIIDAVESGSDEFVYTGPDGVAAEYALEYNAATKAWDVKQETDTTVFDTYAEPTKAHPLGTDRNGMDMLTRLMYGGRVSLIIGFIVVFIETILGVIMGGISGYFGGWVDNLIMRIVDILYCIPSMPIIIIIGAAMDAANLDPSIRMLYLMLILGILGWPGVARLVRGQILSLREQEFMTATEACGISVPRRIFKHLIPNVIPQLIVTMTMGLGSTIILEATLSFLGLGVRFPFASWGNIINDVNNVFVLTHYWNIWIPAGVLLLLTVLAFNIVGDGLRDAFDPKMKR
ncbi:MAG: ABC transporter permease [Clostridia bacterium]|nr:ABC transporter permease [Clostridia bacterium]